MFGEKYNENILSDNADLCGVRTGAEDVGDIKENVLIYVKGTQSIDEWFEPVELVTPGFFGYRNGKCFVKYKETALTGMEGTTTTLTVDDNNRVVLMRSGENNSQFIFEKGEHHVCVYETPYGEFSIGVRTGDISINIDERGGQIVAEYNLDIDNAAFSKNHFHIKIRELETEDFNAGV